MLHLRSIWAVQLEGDSLYKATLPVSDSSYHIGELAFEAQAVIDGSIHSCHCNRNISEEI